jgi:hypothetical protein
MQRHFGGRLGSQDSVAQDARSRAATTEQRCNIAPLALPPTHVGVGGGAGAHITCLQPIRGLWPHPHMIALCRAAVAVCI